MNVRIHRHRRSWTASPAWGARLSAVIRHSAVLLAGAVLSAGLAVAAEPTPADTAAVMLAKVMPREGLSKTTRLSVGEIHINNENIFDLTDPEENRRLYSFANRLHVATREDVIRGQLLFKQGDPFSTQAVEESERILRANDFIYDASITPTAYHDGVVDLAVETRDVWTLSTSLSFKRNGGKNRGGFGLNERNLLGTGIMLGIDRTSGVDRSSTVLEFFDPHLGNSWVSLGARYTSSSDGYAQALQVDRPFYALDSRRAAGFELTGLDQIDSLYDRGEIVDEFRHQQSSGRAYAGWSAGLRDGWVRRWQAGVAYQNDDFSAATGSTLSGIVPEDRRFAYPFIGFELIENDFEKTSNRDQIGRTEDFFLGTRVGAELGWATPAFGSDRSALLMTGSFQTSLQPTIDTTWLFSSQLSGRLDGGQARNTVLSTATRYYRQQSDKRLIYASLQADFAREPDLDNPLTIGGLSGLRGYPLRYQGGDGRVLFSIEQRYFTDWYPFRLFHVGGAVFFDAGRTLGRNPVGDSNLGLLRDVGFGLRLGGSRSGSGNVLHVDLAFPLDGEDSIDNMQLLIESRKSS